MELNYIDDHHEHASASLKVLLLVFALVVVAALGYLVYAQNQLLSSIDSSGSAVKVTSHKAATSTPAATAAVDPTANWKTYSNAVLGFSFKYPPTYTVTDNLQKTKTETNLTAATKLTLKDNATVGKPMLEIYVNPAGFGGTPTNLVYNLKLNTDNTVTVSSKTDAGVKPTDLGYDVTRQIIGTPLGGQKLGTDTYVIRFSYDTGKDTLAKDFDLIVASFKLTK